MVSDNEKHQISYRMSLFCPCAMACSQLSLSISEDSTSHNDVTVTHNDARLWASDDSGGRKQAMTTNLEKEKSCFPCNPVQGMRCKFWEHEKQGQGHGSRSWLLAADGDSAGTKSRAAKGRFTSGRLCRETIATDWFSAASPSLQERPMNACYSKCVDLAGWEQKIFTHDSCSDKLSFCKQWFQLPDELCFLLGFTQPCPHEPFPILREQQFQIHSTREFWSHVIWNGNSGTRRWNTERILLKPMAFPGSLNSCKAQSHFSDHSCFWRSREFSSEFRWRKQIRAINIPGINSHPAFSAGFPDTHF
jgi:hypothetical protein